MGLRDKLKQETKDLHTKIESVPLLKTIMADNITRDQYQILLQGFYGYIAPCEEIIQSLPSHFLLTNREKTALLEKDFLALGMEINSIHKLNRCSHLPDLSNYEHVLGYLYVLEGSTLGGQLIVKMIKKCPAKIHKEVHYFYGYGKNTLAKWEAFCNLLNTVKKGQHTQIIASAHQTYERLYDWMLGYDTERTNYREIP